MNDSWLVAGLTQFPIDIVWATDEMQGLAEITAESMGWLPLDEGTYLHLGNEDGGVIVVVGVPDGGRVGENVLLLGGYE